ncbi:MAG: type III-B CRISPR-associated protein Cas10/Cmr2 [Candidatus Electrothrix sp. AUS4]|nr:type III-B CRISPR-associated protein Cas10/Cmr2 [Candidatus Electrothrix sp. AUS4]
MVSPTTRIAIDPWIRKIKEAENGLADLKIIRDKLESRKYEKILLDTGLMTKVQGNEEIYKDMPFDAGLLYRSFLDATLSKIAQEEKSKEQDAILRSLRDLRHNMIPVWEKHRQPCPYYALLQADGDRMGALIKAAQDKDHHKEISQCLSKFARSVPGIAREYYAHCIYAGGDDVLLMAPLDKVLDLADKLRRDFKEALQSIAKELKEHDLTLKDPTFSVGIVIAHMQTPIGRVRRLVGKAEKLAKDGSQKTDIPRNALAIIVAPRSGADMSFRANWERDPAHKQNDGEQKKERKSPVEELNALATLYRDDKLPSGFGYELRQINQLVHDMGNKEKAGEIAELEMRRILNRKNQGGGGEKVDGDTIKDVIAHAEQKMSIKDDKKLFDFEAVCNEHLIARWLGAHGEERG